jgi:predicted phosphodiesterase
MSPSEHSIALVHLSDIHFHKSISGTIYDLDEDLRNELERDSISVSKDIGLVHGVLITGDIAFSGSVEEYQIALAWLEDYCGKLHCLSENVWCTPGNHDVDRSVIDKNSLLQLLHSELRPDDPDQVDYQIHRYMQESYAADLLYGPIANYNNEFASKFGCQIDAKRPFWEHDLILNDGSVLRLHGVNSTLVSDSLDNDAQHKLVVGSIQGTITRQAGVEYVTLCHHPPTWLRDQDRLIDVWNSRARVQLFGHKHRQRINQINGSVIVTAGATHPDRREPNWRPTYNFLEIWVDGEGTDRQMRIDVHPRRWNDTENLFQADYDQNGSPIRSYRLAIDEWHPLAIVPISESVIEDTGESSLDSEEALAVGEANSESGWKMNPARRLTYRFLRLPYRKRIGISLKLNLIEDNDSGLQDSELFSRVFRRARERNLLEKLWQEVAAAYSMTGEENPYTNM